MSDPVVPLVYVILGASGSGRRDVLADLIHDGLDEDERAVTYLAESELPGPKDGELGRLVRWKWDGTTIDADLEPLAGVTHVFFVLDGHGNPADQLEAFKPWWQSTGAELAQVITVVDCQLLSAHPELNAWFDACIHFSDAVLLARREGVANKWISDFQARYKEQYYPAIFEFVKEGRVKNPPLLLEPLPRRMSHYFDETDWTVVEEEDFEEGSEDEEEGRETNEEVELKEEVDPWFERRAGGRRVKEIVDIRKFLEGR